ncbi:hypothetical protein BVI2075_730010 [Burkholderia vietnamiensis]|nr:hypothetical protein BVI2075_730010 [Burkholderia vietnamiensis]
MAQGLDADAQQAVVVAHRHAAVQLSVLRFDLAVDLGSREADRDRRRSLVDAAVRPDAVRGDGRRPRAHAQCGPLGLVAHGASVHPADDAARDRERLRRTGAARRRAARDRRVRAVLSEPHRRVQGTQRISDQRPGRDPHHRPRPAGRRRRCSGGADAVRAHAAPRSPGMGRRRLVRHSDVARHARRRPLLSRDRAMDAGQLHGFVCDAAPRMVEGLGLHRHRGLAGRHHAVRHDPAPVSRRPINDKQLGRRASDARALRPAADLSRTAARPVDAVANRATAGSLDATEPMPIAAREPGLFGA